VFGIVELNRPALDAFGERHTLDHLQNKKSRPLRF
jgi:hypothetical protein